MADLEYIRNVHVNFKSLVNDLNTVNSEIDYLSFLPLINDSINAFFKTQHIISTKESDVRTIGWDILLPNEHFNNDDISKVLDYCGIDSYDYCWITRVMPGKMLPPIQDVGNEFTRWHCHLTGQVLGQIMFVGDSTFYCEDPGNLYKWKDSSLTYCANNIGNEPQYFLNILKRN